MSYSLQTSNIEPYKSSFYDSGILGLSSYLAKTSRDASIISEMTDELKEIITCPLSGCIFKDPVICSDGNTYEKLAYQYYLSKQSKKIYEIIDNKEIQLFESPTTKEIISAHMIPNHHIKNLVEIILKTKPMLVEKQFYNLKPYYLFDDEFKNFLCNETYENLKNYFKIKLNDIIEGKDCTVAQLIFTCNDNELIKHLLCNSMDLNLSGPFETNPIHSAACLSNPEIIKFMINHLHVDMSKKDIFGNLATHYICEHQKITEEIYDVVTNNEFALEQNSQGLCNIHIISKYNNTWTNFIPFIRSCNLSYFNVPCKNGKYALHYICEFANAETINNAINLDIDLDIECSNDSNAADDFIRLNKKLSREEKRELTRQYLNKRVDIKELKKKRVAFLKVRDALLEDLNELYRLEKINKNINDTSQDNEKVLCPNEQVICSNEQVIYPNEQVICPNEQVICPNEQVICSNEQVICPNEQVICPNDASVNTCIDASLVCENNLEIKNYTHIIGVSNVTEDDMTDDDTNSNYDTSDNESEYEELLVTNFDESHFELDNITEDSSTNLLQDNVSDSNSRITELSTNSLDSVRIYENYSA